jgi:hypothetical protein
MGLWEQQMTYISLQAGVNRHDPPRLSLAGTDKKGCGEVRGTVRGEVRGTIRPASDGVSLARSSRNEAEGGKQLWKGDAPSCACYYVLCMYCPFQVSASIVHPSSALPCICDQENPQFRNRPDRLFWYLSGACERRSHPAQLCLCWKTSPASSSGTWNLESAHGALNLKGSELVWVHLRNNSQVSAAHAYKCWTCMHNHTLHANYLHVPSRSRQTTCPALCVLYETGLRCGRSSDYASDLEPSACTRLI